MWTWTALDADPKLIVSWLVGGRDSGYAIDSWTICAAGWQIACSLPPMGTSAYLEAVEGAFGGDIDYAVLQKLYGTAQEAAKGRYSPAVCTGTRREQIEGIPRPSTSARATSSGRTSRCE